MKQNLYEVIERLLSDDIELRNNDKKLIWKVWEYEGHVNSGILTQYDFVKCSTPETITRCRRKVQENNKSLQATSSVRIERSKKAMKKGNFVYREEIDYNTGLFKNWTLT